MTPDAHELVERLMNAPVVAPDAGSVTRFAPYVILDVPTRDALAARLAETERERDEARTAYKRTYDLYEYTEEERGSAEERCKTLTEALESIDSHGKRLAIDQGQGLQSFIEKALRGGSPSPPTFFTEAVVEVDWPTRPDNTLGGGAAASSGGDS